MAHISSVAGWSPGNLAKLRPCSQKPRRKAGKGCNIAASLCLFCFWLPVKISQHKLEPCAALRWKQRLTEHTSPTWQTHGRKLGSPDRTSASLWSTPPPATPRPQPCVLLSLSFSLSVCPWSFSTLNPQLTTGPEPQAYNTPLRVPFNSNCLTMRNDQGIKLD